ncbi:MAG: CDP-alcohol phosphatidyltransferase family protein [Candidatus Cloacimonetes bacterium]|nr:CDP-alcohol phosphatidyltransferase family protein [Candidatus Cloacimonadota bacterium]
MKEMLTVPNLLGFARILLAPVIFWMLITGNDATFYVMGAALFTDLLDGLLARLLHQITNFGRILDPIADRILFTFALLGLCIRYNYTAWLLFFSIIIVLYTTVYIVVRKDLQHYGVHPNMLGKVCVFLNSFVLWAMTWGVSSQWLLALFTLLLLIPQFNYLFIYLKIRRNINIRKKAD